MFHFTPPSFYLAMVVASILVIPICTGTLSYPTGLGMLHAVLGILGRSRMERYRNPFLPVTC